MKVIHALGKMGIIITIRGRGGGIKLALPPDKINIGEIIRETEDYHNLVPCFGDSPKPCVIKSVCGLKHALHRALAAYFAVLDEYTLADLIGDPLGYRMLLGIERPEQ